MNTTQAQATDPAVPPKPIKPPRLANGHVLCMKKGTAADLGRHVPPRTVFVSLYRATDMTCSDICGGRCVPARI